METKHYLLPVIVILSKLLSNSQNTEQDKLCNMGDIPLMFIVESYVLWRLLLIVLIENGRYGMIACSWDKHPVDHRQI